MITKVNYLNFNREVVQNEKRVIVLFSAPWCLGCNEMFPVFERWSLEYQSFDFKVIDITKNKRLMKKFNISVTPTFVLFYGRETIKRFVGVQTDETFRYFLLNK